MDRNILLSKQKIDELRKTLKSLKKDVFEHDRENAEGGTIQYSYNDATNAEIAIGSKRKKVLELESILKRVKPLPKKGISSTVDVGSWVEMESKDHAKKYFRIVHPLEANPLKNYISCKSDLGKKLLGKKRNETLIFQDKRYIIKKIT